VRRRQFPAHGKTDRPGIEQKHEEPADEKSMEKRAPHGGSIDERDEQRSKTQDSGKIGSFNDERKEIFSFELGV